MQEQLTLPSINNSNYVVTANNGTLLRKLNNSLASVSAHYIDSSNSLTISPLTVEGSVNSYHYAYSEFNCVGLINKNVNSASNASIKFTYAERVNNMQDNDIVMGMGFYISLMNRTVNIGNLHITGYESVNILYNLPNTSPKRFYAEVVVSLSKAEVILFINGEEYSKTNLKVVSVIDGSILNISMGINGSNNPSYNITNGFLSSAFVSDPYLLITTKGKGVERKLGMIKTDKVSVNAILSNKGWGTLENSSNVLDVLNSDKSPRDYTDAVLPVKSYAELSINYDYSKLPSNMLYAKPCIYVNSKIQNSDACIIDNTYEGILKYTTKFLPKYASLNQSGAYYTEAPLNPIINAEGGYFNITPLDVKNNTFTIKY